jgi:hypothetical protein
MWRPGLPRAPSGGPHGANAVWVGGSVGAGEFRLYVGGVLVDVFLTR